MPVNVVRFDVGSGAFVQDIFGNASCHFEPVRTRFDEPLAHVLECDVIKGGRGVWGCRFSQVHDDSSRKNRSSRVNEVCNAGALTM
jgi:hypothetical protein